MYCHNTFCDAGGNNLPPDEYESENKEEVVIVHLTCLWASNDSMPSLCKCSQTRLTKHPYTRSIKTLTP